MYDDQLKKIVNDTGFIAALDQSGGSTPKALALYGVSQEEYSSEEEMFALVHKMRSRIITNPSFTGERILGAILFEDTMHREIQGKPTSQYLWAEKHIVPFLKVDKGLADMEDGVQIMKPMPALDTLLSKAKEKNIFGTKMRSVIKLANKQGISRVVAQQFAVAKQILAVGLMPIIEPEVDIHSEEKEAAEQLLKEEILSQLAELGENTQVMLKLSLPTVANFYKELVDHPKVLKVVALSGGYLREEANEKTTANNGVIASFSRALTEGLRASQSDEEFTKLLDTSIQSIYVASNT
jgi:fructose-bisphosphate aldolase class I